MPKGSRTAATCSIRRLDGEDGRGSCAVASRSIFFRSLNQRCFRYNNARTLVPTFGSARAQSPAFSGSVGVAST